MERKKLRWQLPVLLLLIVGTMYVLQKQNRPYQKSTGRIFGTIYHATYQYGEDLNEEIMAELLKVDASLSPFNEQSVISKINRNEDFTPDELFITTFDCAQEISKRTDGAFDFTIAPLANAWGFGFKKGIEPDSATIDSLLQLTDYRKVSYQNGKIVKEDRRIMLSGSAIAKGYAADVVGKYLRSKGIDNYMVEVGGEVVVSGKNPQQQDWRIAINKAINDSLGTNTDIQAVLQISDMGMATSGNYRNYYYKDGKKYAHTIDPRTGYPVELDLLSATVLAESCMKADGFATAFMVMGFEKAKEFIESTPNHKLEVYFIYTDAEGNTKTYHSKGMEKYILEERE